MFFSRRSSRLSEVSDLSKGTKDAGFGSDSSVNSDVSYLFKLGHLTNLKYFVIR